MAASFKFYGFDGIVRREDYRQQEVNLKISTIAVPIGALIGLIIGVVISPTSYGLLIGTVIGGLIGGSIGLYFSRKQKTED